MTAQIFDWPIIPIKPADRSCPVCLGELEHVSRIGRRLVEHCRCRSTKRTISNDRDGAEMRAVEAK